MPSPTASMLRGHAGLAMRRCTLPVSRSTATMRASRSAVTRASGVPPPRRRTRSGRERRGPDQEVASVHDLSTTGRCPAGPGTPRASTGVPVATTRKGGTDEAPRRTARLHLRARRLREHGRRHLGCATGARACLPGARRRRAGAADGLRRRRARPALRAPGRDPGGGRTLLLRARRREARSLRPVHRRARPPLSAARLLEARGRLRERRLGGAAAAGDADPDPRRPHRAGSRTT